MHFGLIVEGNFCPAFGGTGGCFVRPAVPRVVRSIRRVHECLSTSSHFVKALPATFSGFCQIHKCVSLKSEYANTFTHCLPFV